MPASIFFHMLRSRVGGSTRPPAGLRARSQSRHSEHCFSFSRRPKAAPARRGARALSPAHAPGQGEHPAHCGRFRGSRSRRRSAIAAEGDRRQDVRPSQIQETGPESAFIQNELLVKFQGAPGVVDALFILQCEVGFSPELTWRSAKSDRTGVSGQGAERKKEEG